MLRKIKQKVKEKGRRYANNILGTSPSGSAAGHSTAASISNSVTTNTPAPTTALPESSSSNPNVSTPQVAPISSLQPVVVSSALPSTDPLPPTSQTSNPNLPVVPDPILVQVTSSASVTHPHAERSAKSTAWSGLKTLLDLLNASADAFEPLKSAVGGISECINIYERVAKAREDYNKLRAELDSLFWELYGYLNGPTPPPPMISSLANLAKGIEREIELVREKERRNRVERTVEAKEDVDEILECYRRIQSLLGRFSLNADVNIWKTVDEQATENRLKSLSPSQAARYGSFEKTDLRRNGCIPNTRIGLLDELKSWAENSSSKRIYWLNGMAGTGKTTIAYSLCDQLESRLTLAASFFCSRQLPSCRSVNLIIPTIAYQLARFSPPFRHALSSALEQSPDAYTLELSTQFQKLIVEPLQVVPRAKHADLVVVIDALDECDSKDGVDQILETLLLHAPDLPIKFFVTSRPEARILDKMHSEESRGVPVRLDLHNLDRSVVREDIQTYLKTKLDSPKLTLTDVSLKKLVDQSGVLFIYAATVVRYIAADNFSRGATRLKQVLSGFTSSHNDASVEIDTLYEGILGAALDDKALTASDRREMKDVLHTVLCAQEPMTVSVIAGLLRLDVGLVEAALRPLNSVLHLSSEANGTVTTFHESFPDYIFDKNRSGAFSCDAGSHNALLARRCFNAIGMCSPQFNICNLESSYVFDKDVPELGRRIRDAISDEMFYACRFWGPHFVSAETSPELLDALRDFLLARLLLWMEVMNLKRCISAGVGVLHQMQVRLQVVSSLNDMQELAVDAWRFALDFSTTAMSLSTPHIYTSALPFWPDHRPISRCYSSRMRGTRVSGAGMFRRSSAPLAVCTIPSEVKSVGYSHDGTCIVSGSDDGTIQIWDVYTGQMVGEPLVGHTWSVTSVGYSHDSTRIVSSSSDKTIRIWDAHTGQMVGKPLVGHTGAVRSVGYSHDGTRIVSGSSDKTIRIWDAHTGQMVGEPLVGHTSAVLSVGYSHDSTRIVSSSYDKTIRIWNAHTGQKVGKPLVGHTDSVHSVGYSYDGTRIVSGSYDKTIRIWDAHTGQKVGEPLVGHTSAVNSVGYSHNSTRIVSSSYDKTIRIWDAYTGQMVGEPLVGHTDAVNSVGYSHDGTRIVSGSSDKTIRIWDAYTGQKVGEPLVGHTSAVNSVGYSHNSTRIVSSSSDKTIRIWDAHTGQMVGEPLVGHTDAVKSVGYSHDDTRIVSGSSDKTIRIWDAHTGQMVGEPLVGHTDAVLSVGYSHDGTHIVSSSYDKTIRIWDAHTGQNVGEPLVGHTDSVHSVGYSRDGTRIVSGSDDMTIRIWDAYTGQMVGKPLVGHIGAVTSVGYSYDGTRIVSGSYDMNIRIWNAHTGQMVGNPLVGHTGAVNSVGYSHDGTRIVSGSDDMTIRVWDAHTGQMVGEPLVGHTGVVISVGYSHDSTRIVSGSDDKTIRIWDAHTSQTVDELFNNDSAPKSADQIARHSHLSLDHPLGFNNPLSNYPVSKPHAHWKLGADGWVLEDGFKLLIWVPPDVRGYLAFPPILVTISTLGSLNLDFSCARLGENWHMCYVSEPVLSL